MKRVKRYSDEFKKTVVNDVLSGNICPEHAKHKYGISGSCTIATWVKKFEDSVPKRLFMNEQKEKTVEELKLEIEQLKHQLEYEKLKSQAFDTMIDIAEQEFKISIRKKSGAKQSKK